MTVLFDDNVDLTNINSNALVKLQEADAILKGCLEQANIVDNEESAYACSNTGALVRRVPDKFNEGRHQDLIDVPYCLHSKILRITHDMLVDILVLLELEIAY